MTRSGTGSAPGNSVAIPLLLECDARAMPDERAHERSWVLRQFSRHTCSQKGFLKPVAAGAVLEFSRVLESRA